MMSGTLANSRNGDTRLQRKIEEQTQGGSARVENMLSRPYCTLYSLFKIGVHKWSG